MKPWLEEDVAFLREHPQLSNAEAADALGRTRHSVGSMRSKLRRGGQPTRPYGREHSPAWLVGRRPLVAKTCTICGLLLDAEWFALSKRGLRYTRCRACHSQVSRGDADRRQAWTRRVQMETALLASRERDEWTDADFAVISRSDLTLEMMAKMLGRSLSAVANARSRLALADRCLPLGEPEESWVIRPRDKATA